MTLRLDDAPYASPFQFCPRCGAAGLDRPGPKLVQCPRCDFSLFFNVAAAVAALIIHDHGLLVTRRRYDPAAGTLDLPGGFVDPGETAREALQREIYEELSLEVTRADFFCSLPNRYPYGGIEYRTLDLAFVCRIKDISTLKPGDDVAGCRWVPVQHLQPGEFGLQSIKKLVVRYRDRVAG